MKRWPDWPGTRGARLIFAGDTTAAQVDRIRNRLAHIGADGYFLFGADTPGWADAAAFAESGAAHAPDVPLSPGDPMTIFYSSGTTGEPKGIAHTHFGRLNYCYGFGAGLGVNRYTVAVCTTPIYASGTLITMLPTLYYGGKVVLVEKFSAPAFFEAVTREGGDARLHGARHVRQRGAA
ncbi:AMP-binding protein [Novosphingobium colocasiae]